jgi:hypothetical protein
MQTTNMDLDALLFRSWLTGGGSLLGGIDGLTLLAILAVAVLYFFAPVFGYRTGQRGMLLASMWVLIFKMALALLRVCIFALELLDRSSVSTGSGSRTTMQYVFVLISVFETGLFVLGIVLFVLGLTALRRDMDLPRGLPRGFRDD